MVEIFKNYKFQVYVILIKTKKSKSAPCSQNKSSVTRLRADHNTS